ncbi:MAG: hypothetical protein ACYS0D_10160, partial [Planctomycetota bacterium]
MLPLALVVAPLSASGQGLVSPAGYVDDRDCARCHREIWESYKHVGMARSFARPNVEMAIEDFEQGFYHAPSRRHYEMRVDGDQFVMRRWQLDEAGEAYNELEIPVD